jgi:hypothetical protein
MKAEERTAEAQESTSLRKSSMIECESGRRHRERERALGSQWIAAQQAIPGSTNLGWERGGKEAAKEQTSSRRRRERAW